MLPPLRGRNLRRTSAKTPKRSTTRVKTEAGDAWFIDGQILTQLVLCQFDDGKREKPSPWKIVAFDQPKPVMSDGRTMQTPNDRPPMDMINGGPAGPGGRPPRGPRPPGPPPMQRPKPGAPAQGPVGGGGDPLATTGPTGGDLSAQPDEIDDLIADAMDPTPPFTLPNDDEGDPRAAMPLPPAATPEPRANEKVRPAESREKPPKDDRRRRDKVETRKGGGPSRFNPRGKAANPSKVSAPRNSSSSAHRTSPPAQQPPAPPPPPAREQQPPTPPQPGPGAPPAS